MHLFFARERPLSMSETPLYKLSRSAYPADFAFTMNEMWTLVVLSVYYVAVECGEPVCSRFHYEERLLEKMIRTEIKMEEMIKEVKNIEHRVNGSLKKVTDSLRELTEEENSKLTEGSTIATVDPVKGK